jgi:hypothetical protein
MPLIYSSVVKAARLQTVLDHVRRGSLRIHDGAGVLLFTVPLNLPAGAVTGGALVFQGPLNSSPAIASGTAVEARLVGELGDEMVSGLLIGTGAAEVNLVTTTVEVGDQLVLDELVIYHA